MGEYELFSPEFVFTLGSLCKVRQQPLAINSELSNQPTPNTFN